MSYSLDAAGRSCSLGDPLTLNVTVASRYLSVQTSDFRLTRGDTGAITSNSAQKQVVLHYMGWSGLLCYTGLAS